MVFGDGQSNGVIQFYLKPSLVAMATKFGTTWAITRFVSVYLRDFCVYKGFSGMGHWILPIEFYPDWLINGNFTQRSNTCNNTIS